MVDLESNLDGILLVVLQCIVVFTILLVVFLTFRAHVRVAPAVPVEGESGVAQMCWAFAGILLCFALLVAAKHLGIYAKPRDNLDLLIPVLAFNFGQWQLRALLNPPGSPPCGPGEACGPSA